MAARSVTLTLSLLTVPLALGYLGPERYGIWIAISSLAALISVVDLGVSAGLINAVTKYDAHGETQRAREAISSAAGMLSGVASFLAAILLLTMVVLPWERLVGAEPSLAAEVRPAIALALLCFLATQPASVASNIRIARQEGWTVHFAAAAGQVGALVALLLVIAVRGSLAMVALAACLPPLLAIVANGLVLFRRDAPELTPSLQAASAATGSRLLRSGSPFFVIQVSMFVAFASDALVVAQIVGPEGVAAYGVASRLFAIPLGIVALALAPLWPAYGEAIARGDLPWIRRTLRSTLKISLALSVLASVLFVMATPWLIDRWIGETIDVPPLLIVAFGAWVPLSALGTSVAMFLNGAGEIRWQAISAVIMAVANLALSIVLTRQIGVAGVMWGTVIAYSSLTLAPMAIYAPRILKATADRVARAAADPVNPSLADASR
ncbi:MAG: oligosaccharide flippase family protein [Chloroflexota bacterium]